MIERADKSPSVDTRPGTLQKLRFKRPDSWRVFERKDCRALDDSGFQKWSALGRQIRSEMDGLCVPLILHVTTGWFQAADPWQAYALSVPSVAHSKKEGKHSFSR